MRVVFFGTYNVETTPRVQVIIDGFRAHNIEVVECNVPLPVSTAERIAILKQPWRLPVLGWRIAVCWRQLWRKAKRLPKADAVVIGHLGQFDIHLAKRLFPDTPLVLDCMVTVSGAAADRNLQGKGSAKIRLVKWLDESAFKLASTIVVDTAEHQALLPKFARTKSVVVPVGAPLEYFAAGEKRKPAKPDVPLQVLFYGNYIPLQGAPVIGKALSHLKTPMIVTMIGSGQDEAATKLAAVGAHIAVTWIPWLDSKALIKLLATQDVCLGIFGTTAKAKRVVPNKVFGGAAAGCAIITSDTPPQRRLLDGAAILVPAGDDRALTAALERLAGDRDEVERLQHAAYELARKSFTPEAVAAPPITTLTNS